MQDARCNHDTVATRWTWWPNPSCQGHLHEETSLRSVEKTTRTPHLFPRQLAGAWFCSHGVETSTLQKDKRSQCQCFWFELLRSSSFEVFLTVKKSRGLFAVEIHGYQCSSEEAYCSWRFFLGHIQPPKVQHSQLKPLASLKHPVEHPIFVVSTLSS